MLRIEPAEPTPALWADRATYADRLIFHTPAWLRFVAEAQRAEPVLATIADGGTRVGHFTGLLTKRYGFRILGSPMAGWIFTSPLFRKKALPSISTLVRFPPDTPASL